MSVARATPALRRWVRSRLLVAAVGGVCTAVVLAGCTSNAEPSPLPEPTVSASLSPSASATPPSLPAEAEGTSPKAAKAFVRYWVDALNYAGDHGDTRALRDSSEQDCTACRGVIKTIDDTTDAGGAFQGKGWSVRTMKYQPLQPKSRPVLTVGIFISPQVVTESEGAEPKRFKGGKRSMTFRLKYSGGKWTVANLEQAA